MRASSWDRATGSSISRRRHSSTSSLGTSTRASLSGLAHTSFGGRSRPVPWGTDPQAPVRARSHKSLCQCAIFPARDSRWYSRSGATQPVDGSPDTLGARSRPDGLSPVRTRGDDGTKKRARQHTEREAGCPEEWQWSEPRLPGTAQGLPASPPPSRTRIPEPKGNDSPWLIRISPRLSGPLPTSCAAITSNPNTAR